MEEIKMGVIDGSQIEELNSVNVMESEKLLEAVLVNSPDFLLEDLTLVGRQTRNEGGALDLLGVDGDGKLAVFELKRSTLHREAVAQVIDYASSLDSMDLDELAEYISEKSGQYDIDKIEDFEDWYSQYSEDLESLKPLRMFLVGLGVDPDTERMVKFLAENSSMDISLLTFHGFNHDGKTILAKRVEVEGHDGGGTPSEPRKRNLSDVEKWNMLLNRADKYRVSRNFFNSVWAMFQQNWPESIENTGGERLSFKLPESRRQSGHVYARLSFQSDKLVIRFYPRAFRLCWNSFTQIREEIPWLTSPRDGKLVEGEDSDTKIEFILSSDEWDTHRGRLTDLAKAIYQAWQDREQQEGKGDASQ